MPGQRGNALGAGGCNINLGIIIFAGVDVGQRIIEFLRPYFNRVGKSISSDQGRFDDVVLVTRMVTSTVEPLSTFVP